MIASVRETLSGCAVHRDQFPRHGVRLHHRRDRDDKLHPENAMAFLGHVESKSDEFGSDHASKGVTVDKIFRRSERIDVALPHSHDATPSRPAVVYASGHREYAATFGSLPQRSFPPLDSGDIRVFAGTYSEFLNRPVLSVAFASSFPLTGCNQHARPSRVACDRDTRDHRELPFRDRGDRLKRQPTATIDSATVSPNRIGKSQSCIGHSVNAGRAAG